MVTQEPLISTSPPPAKEITAEFQSWPRTGLERRVASGRAMLHRGPSSTWEQASILVEGYHLQKSARGRGRGRSRGHGQTEREPEHGGGEIQQVALFSSSLCHPGQEPFHVAISIPFEFITVT